jgi:hypothetical protein
MRKDWIYAQELDVNILALRESGSLDTLKNRWFDGNTCSGSSGTDPNTARGYKIQSLAGLFLTFTIISIHSFVIIIICIIETVYYKRLIIQTSTAKRLVSSTEWFY